MKTYLTIILFVFSSSQVLAYNANVRGFLTFAYSISDNEAIYQGNISKDGEYSKGTKAGIQFSSVLSSKVDGFIQMLADGDNGRDFNFALDIAHVNYNFNDDQKVLYGKIRLPVYLISDYQQVGSLYPWINPPEEVYKIAPLEDIGANNTFFGISFEGNLFQSKKAGQLRYRLYSGGSERVSEKQNATGSIEVKIKNLSGSVLEYSYGDFELKASYLNIASEGERFDYDLDAYLSSQAFRTEYSALGFKYETDYSLWMSEYSKVKGDTKEINELVSYYLMGGIYLNDNKVLVHATFSEVSDTTKSNRDLGQATMAYGLNLNLDLSTILKLEFKKVKVKNTEKTDGSGDSRPVGFFKKHPGRDVHIMSSSINTMF